MGGDDFTFEIKGDTSRTARWIDALERQLANVTTTAAAAGSAITAAGSKAASAMQFASDRARAMAASTGNAFAGLTEHFRREAEILEKIHGPMLQYEADLRALNALHQKGMVTAEQYASQLARIRGSAGLPTQVGNNFNDKPAGGGMGDLMTAGAVALVAHEIKELGDEYLILKSKLRAVATDEDNLNSLLEKSKNIAQETRSDWESIVTVYQRFQIATRDLHVSQEQVLAMTKTLSQGLQIGGATAFEAQMSMMELSHAFQTGTLTGREFRVMMKDAAPLMAELQKVSGHTAAEFAEMGKHGKLTAEVLIDLFAKAAPAIEEKFGKTIPTLTQQWTMFKNELIETVGKFVEASGIIPIVGNILGGLVGIIKPVLGALGQLASGIGWVAGKVSDLGHAAGVDLKIGLGTVAGFIAGGPMGAAIGTFAEGLVRSRTNLEELMKGVSESNWQFRGFAAQVEATGKSANELTESAIKLIEALSKVHERMSDTTYLAVSVAGMTQSKRLLDAVLAGLKEEDVILKRVYGSSVDHHNEINAIVRAYGAGIISLKQFNEQLAETERKFSKTKRTGRGRDPGNPFWDLLEKDLKGVVSDVDDLNRQIERGADDLRALSRRFADAAERSERARQKAAAAAAAERAAYATKQWNKELEGVNKRFDSIMEHLQPIEDALVRLATTGKFSWREMINSMLADLSRLAAHKLLAAIVGAAFGGDITSMASSAGAGTPGYAHGGSFRVGGVGGTDSQLVAFRASPSERVTITTPEQERDGGGPWGGGGPSGAPPAMMVVLEDDARAFRHAIATRDGRAAVVRTVDQSRRRKRGGVAL